MNSSEKSLTAVTLIYTAGNFASKVISLFLVFIVTFYLSKEAVGQFDLIITTIALLAPLISLQLSDAILRWIIKDRNVDTISNVLTNVFFVVCINLLVFSLFYWGIISYLNIEHPLVIYFLLLLNVLFPLFHITARSLGKNIEFALSGLIFSVIYFSLTIVALKFLGLKIDGLLIAYSIGIFGAILYLIIKIRYLKYFSKKHISIDRTRQYIRYSLPLLPNTISWWAIAASNRYLILAFLGVAANGIFAISFKIPTILLTLTGIFYLAWQEKAIQTYDKADRDIYYSQVLEKYVRLLLSAVLVLIAFNKLILTYIVDRSFFEAWKYTPILLIAVIFQTLSSFYGTGYLSSKDTKGAFTTSVYGGLTTVGTSFLLIPYYGLYGASFAILLGYFVMFIARVIQTKKYFSIKFPLKIFLILSLLICFTAIISITGNNLLFAMNLVLSLFVFGIFNRKMIFSYSKILNNKIFR
ncbi:MAG: polysaccharide biosynthesis C-terminal domain-containing protein [Bacteroidota bacterium]|nr:polysaccharide biosynthesis C-terminal domain-containing protein [Bacteroidota bacterium]